MFTPFVKTGIITALLPVIINKPEVTSGYPATIISALGAVSRLPEATSSRLMIIVTTTKVIGYIEERAMRVERDDGKQKKSAIPLMGIADIHKLSYL